MYLGLYFRPISFQLEPGSEPHSMDAEGSLHRKGLVRGMPPLQLILAPVICLYITTVFFAAFMSKWWGHKDSDIIGVRGYLCRKRTNKMNAAQARTCLLVPKPPEQGLQSEDIEKMRQEQLCRNNRSIANAFERFPFTCSIARGLWYIMLIHLRISALNPAISKTDAKNRWSTLSKTLDWSKLINVASVPSFIPSRTSRTQCRLSWIDLPFTAKVLSGLIRLLKTSCKRF